MEEIERISCYYENIFVKRIPEEIFINIFEFCVLKDLFVVMNSCRHFYKIINSKNEIVWRNFLKNYFPFYKDVSFNYKKLDIKNICHNVIRNKGEGSFTFVYINFNEDQNVEKKLQIINKENIENFFYISNDFTIFQFIDHFKNIENLGGEGFFLYFFVDKIQDFKNLKSLSIFNKKKIIKTDYHIANAEYRGISVDNRLGFWIFIALENNLKNLFYEGDNEEFEKFLEKYKEKFKLEKIIRKNNKWIFFQKNKELEIMFFGKNKKDCFFNKIIEKREEELNKI